jgi:ABC-type multidrug transport system fused ATPase/permease subunit
METNLVKHISEDATELSGGEMQRLLLARALYKNAPFIILDEPTAALDPIAENEIYLKYDSLTKDRTSVYISHRLSSTRFCDRIIFIDGAKIAECGTHEELMARGGKYAEMFEIQSRYYRENGGEAV